MLLASLALLLGASSAAAACSAEAQCVDSSCGEAYGTPATALPYSVDYTTTGDSLTTTFHFKARPAPRCTRRLPACLPSGALHQC